MQSIVVPESLFLGNVGAYLHLAVKEECRVSIERPGSSNLQGTQVQAVLLSIDEYNRLALAAQKPAEERPAASVDEQTWPRISFEEAIRAYPGHFTFPCKEIAQAIYEQYQAEQRAKYPNQTN